MTFVQAFVLLVLVVASLEGEDQISQLRLCAWLYFDPTVQLSSHQLINTYMYWQYGCFCMGVKYLGWVMFACICIHPNTQVIEVVFNRFYLFWKKILSFYRSAKPLRPVSNFSCAKSNTNELNSLFWNEKFDVWNRASICKTPQSIVNKKPQLKFPSCLLIHILGYLCVVYFQLDHVGITIIWNQNTPEGPRFLQLWRRHQPRML